MRMLFLYCLALIAVAECASRENIISTKKNLNATDDLLDDRIINTGSETCMRLITGHHTSPSGLSGLGDIERLVVYLYRTKATDDVYIFTPQKNFQLCFPDLSTDEEGDLMIVDSDELQALLNSNTNVIPMDYFSDSDRYDFSTDFEDPMGFDYSQGNTKIKPIGSVQTNIHYNNEIVLPPPSKYIPPRINERDDGNGEIEYYPEETTIVDNSYSDGNKFLSHSYKESNPGEIEDFFDFRDLHKISSFSPNKQVNDLYNSVTSNDIFLPLHSILGKQTTFDDWFMQQLYRFIDSGDRLDQNINLRELKSDVEKILHDNHIFIRNDGILTDHRGMVINPSNLQLRPILIGDSVAYKKILSLRDSTFSFPSNLPYLDTVVVTQAFPSRLLGIIPLGKTFIPKSSRGRVINPWPRYPNNIMSKDTASIAFRDDNNYSPTVVPKKRNVINETFAIIKNFRKALDTKESNSTESGPKIKPISTLLSVYKTLFGQLLGKTGKPILDSEMPSESEPAKKPSEEVSEYEDLEIDDDLGFKIIGGNPATSSGTPLSNRGRSANFFDRFN